MNRFGIMGWALCLTVFFGNGSVLCGSDIRTGLYLGHLRQPRTVLGVYAEYHMEPLVAGLRPVVALEWEEQRAGYLAAGLSLQLNLISRLSLHLSQTAGYYRQGAGFDMGSALQFRTLGQFEIALPVWNSRLSLGLSHHSNASLYERNPGKESVRLGWVVGF